MSITAICRLPRAPLLCFCILRIRSLSCFTINYAATRLQYYPASATLASSAEQEHQQIYQQETTLIGESALDCWNLDAVNPSLFQGRIVGNSSDYILQRFNSPAHQAMYIVIRAVRDHGCSASTLQQCQYLLKPGFRFVIQEDSYWDVWSEDEISSRNDFLVDVPNASLQSTLQLARSLLSQAVNASEGKREVDYSEMQDIISRAKKRLNFTLGTDVRGRTSADAAFSFALAGCTDMELFDLLAETSRLELKRVGKKSSFKSSFVLQMVEKMAAAGIDIYKTGVADIAIECLEAKNVHVDVVEQLKKKQLNMFSERPLLWLWRFSSKLRKVADTRQTNESQRTPLANLFQNPQLPLVIDLGSGMGVSLLGLSTLSKNEDEVIDWQNCNYLGCDTNPLTLNFARGVAQRWNIEDRVQFLYSRANECIEEISSEYPGPVRLVMVQFPTPFRLDSSTAVGNTQLPLGVESGFMVSSGLVSKIDEVLDRSSGQFLVQSNCEDVAVKMRSMVEDVAGMKAIRANETVQDIDVHSLTQRTQTWISLGGTRAIGDGWSRIPYLPAQGFTETEVSCRHFGTPIHRCLLKRAIE